jgi:hypothetical protein
MTWTAPEITRVMKPFAEPAGDERTLADAWLDFHRQTLLWKCGGLTAQQLKLRAVERSNLSLLGLVRHMAEVERDWFRTRFAGAQAGYLYCSDDDMNAEDPGRCAEGMNGLVNVGCPSGNNGRNLLRCQQSLGTGDTCRRETRQMPRSPHIPGDIYRWGSQLAPVIDGRPLDLPPSLVVVD